MGILDSLLSGLGEARRRLGQTLLSLLGLILGTASIIAVLALFGGQAKNTQKYLDEVGGVGTIIVRDRPLPPEPSPRDLASKRLTYADAQYLRERSRSLQAVSSGWSRQLRYQAGAVGFSGEVIGTVPHYAVINDIRPLVGRFLSDLDLESQTRVAVLGWKFADSLFGRPAAALDQLIQLDGKTFRVVGVLEREEFYFAAWDDNSLEYRNRRAYIPLTTAIAQYAENDRLGFLTLKATAAAGPRLAEAEVRSLLFARHGVEDFDIAPSGGGGMDRDDAQFLTMFNYIFLVVGVVSLFTGGVVIANVLLASVVERIRELGTLMAIGATTGSIFLQLLAEVLLVTLMGGLIGLGLGAGLTGLVAHLMQMPAAVTPGIAGLGLGTSLLVGFLAGLYPAWRASRITPVEALRA
ncbi:MAG TPA: ABC transporter permease [Gemmatimonadales bacterium]|nr:ABC transporter permease [Gemmatimonadales bacterium]